MRQKPLLLLSIFCLLSSSLYAQEVKKKDTGLIGDRIISTKKQGSYGMAGCGLGSVLFGESEHRGGQILAGTTNSIYSNNTFGMSSGTSECVQEPDSKTAEARKNLEKFIVANQGSLENDIVRRQGDTIVAVTNILGCSNKDYFAATLQANYESLFQTKKSDVIAQSMVNMIKNDGLLNETCNI